MSLIGTHAIIELSCTAKLKSWQILWFTSCTAILESSPVSSGSANAELIGGIVGGVLSVIVVAVVVILLILLCLYRRHHHTTNVTMKKTEL